jgi:hypothetical protein
MFLTKLKLAALILVPAATMVAAGATVLARQEEKKQEAAPAPAASDAAPKPVQLPPVPASPRANDPFRKDAAIATEPTGAGPGESSRAGVPTAELAARLKLARERLKLAEQRHRTGAVPISDYVEAAGAVEILEAQILGQFEQLRDELELLRIRLKARQAELARAEALAKKERIAVEGLQKLVERHVVSSGELDTAETSRLASQSEVELKKAELEEAVIREGQVERKMKQLIPLLKDFIPQPNEPATNAAPPPVPPPPAPRQ